MTSGLAFVRVYPPRPLDAEMVSRLLSRLAGADVPRPLVFETWALDDGVHHLVGCPGRQLESLKTLIRGVIHAVQFEPGPRPDAIGAASIRARNIDLPLGHPAPESTVEQLLAAFAERRAGEALGLQLILSSTRHPATVPTNVPDPLQPLGSKLTRGMRPAASSLRRELGVHAAAVRFAATIRIGTVADDPARREHLARRVFGAMQLLESSGTHFTLRPEAPSHFTAAKRGKLLLLTADELPPFIAWPLGDGQLQGVDPVHPKRLQVPTSVASNDGVFAEATAAGPRRLVGLTPHARLSHVGVLSPTGSGKSESVLVPLLLSDVAVGRPIVLVDPKAQLVEFVLDRLPKSAADRVVLIDPSDREGTAGFNPLDVGDRDPHVVVDSVLAVLRETFADGWGPRSEDLLSCALTTLALDGVTKPQPHTLLDMARLLTEPAFRRSVIGSVASDPVLGPFWAQFEQMPATQRDAMLAAPLNKLRRLNRPNVAAVLGQPRPAFRIRDVFNSDAIVLVALNEALVGPLAARMIGGLICAEVFLATQERAREKNPMARPGMVFVDEVASFLHLPIPIGTALEVSRSHGVGWHLFGQGQYQLGPSLSQAFEINTRSKITFATSLKEARRLVDASPGVDAEDIAALPKYEVYANLMTSAGASGWFSAKTLEPPKALGHGESFRALSRRVNRFQSPAEAPEQVATEPTSPGHVRRRRS